MKIVHEEMKELLPWFVNGTLNESEQSLVHRHLDDCEECREDVQQLIELSGAFSAPDPLDRIDAAAEADAFVERLPARRYPARSTNWLAAAACVVIVVAGLLIAIPPHQRFKTLTADPAGAPGDKDVVQVVFKPDATERTIREVLLHEGNVVLSGPSRLGVYRVAVSDDESDVYVALLKHDPNVIFVEKETNR